MAPTSLVPPVNLITSSPLISNATIPVYFESSTTPAAASSELDNNVGDGGREKRPSTTGVQSKDESSTEAAVSTSTKSTSGSPTSSTRVALEVSSTPTQHRVSLDGQARKEMDPVHLPTTSIHDGAITPRKPGTRKESSKRPTPTPGLIPGEGSFRNSRSSGKNKVIRSV